MANRGPQRWFFDVWSWIYDAPWVQRATYRPVHDAVLRALHQGRCRRVLDLGCGTGQLASRLKGTLSKSQVVGADFSAGMLSRAKLNAPAVAWVQADATRLPFRDGSFDVITSTEAFHWFPDQATTLAECFRVLRPGGRLLLGLVNPPVAVVSQVAWVASRLVGEPFYWPTAPEMRRRVEAAGFHVEAQQRVFRLPGLLLLPVLTRAVRPARALRRRPFDSEPTRSN